MTLEKPQIITHITKTLPYTPYDCKWVPCSARFIVLGQHPRGTGALQVYELSEGEAKVVQQVNNMNDCLCVEHKL